MKLPSYMKTEFPTRRDGKTIAKIYVKWWGWPIVFRKEIIGRVEANWLGWLCLLFYIFPKVWFCAINAHKGINITFQGGDCKG